MKKSLLSYMGCVMQKCVFSIFAKSKNSDQLLHPSSLLATCCGYSESSYQGTSDDYHNMHLFGINMFWLRKKSALSSTMDFYIIENDTAKADIQYGTGLCWSHTAYHIYPKYSDTSTPYHICSKIWTSTIHYPMLCLKIAGWVANSVDPDETPHSAASHLGLYFCSGLSVQIHTVNTVAPENRGSRTNLFSYFSTEIYVVCTH